MSGARGVFAATLKSFGYAIEGLCLLVRSERNARLHLAATVAVVIAGLVLRISLGDWRWIAVAIGIVWCAEAFNTSIEQLCNLVRPGADPIVKVAKDIAAGAVLIAAMTAAVIGVMTLLPYLLAILSP